MPHKKKTSSSPPLLVPSLLWGGGGDIGSLYKVPLHTLGTAKKRYLRLKPFSKNNDNDGSSSSWIEVALVDDQTTVAAKKYYVVKAAHPLALIWNEPTKTSASSSDSLLSSPFKKKSRDNDGHEILLEDIVQVAGGNRTAAFQAFIAKNGNWCVPNESCCFSLISAKRSVDFYVQSGRKNMDGRDAKMATAWKDSIQKMLDNFHRKQDAAHNPLGSIASSSSTVRSRIHQRWDSKLHCESLFNAAKSSDVGTLRWYFDHGCAIDFMDETTGDSVLIVACRLGLFDVAQLALLGYNARNDPHPDFGQTALQVAVSAGHTRIVRLILETAEPSGADRIIANHEDENGEAPLHVAARCGSMEIMELLFMHGANLGLIDGRGRTCLHCASQSGQASCLTFALDSGDADEYLEVLSNDGFTPLHIAVRANKYECVKILLRAGALVSSETASGLNVYNLASKQRSERIMTLLLDYDVSEAESYYDSYDEDSHDSSLSGEDMFRGLNKYTVGPAKQSPSHQNYYNGSPMCAGGAAPLHSAFAGGQIYHSPLVAGASAINTGHVFPQQNHVRFNTTPHHASEDYNQDCDYTDSERGEFYLAGELWKIFVTRDGHPYFYNVNQDSSTWEDPRSTFAAEMYTPQQPSYESPMPCMNEGAVRSFSGQNHDRQTQLVSTPLKLTAIPQTGTSAVRLLSPGASAAMAIQNTCDYGELNQLTAPQPRLHSTTKSVASYVAREPAGGHAADESNPIETPTKGPPASEPETDENVADPTSILLAQIKIAGASKTVKNVQARTPLTMKKAEEADPKSMLLAQIKTRGSGAIPVDNPTPLLSSTQPKTKKKDVDPKVMLLAHIKSRAAGSGSAIQSTQRPELPGKLSKDDLNTTAQVSADGAPSETPRPVITRPNAKETLPSIKTPKRQSKDQMKNMLMQDEAVKKFMRMTLVGVPVQAVVHKMKQEGVDAAKIDLFKEYHGLISSAAELPLPSPRKTPTTSTKRYANISIEDLKIDSTFSKYLKMNSVGVPLMAVVTKMSQDGFEKEKIMMFSVAFGLKSTSAASPKPFPMPPMHHERRRASKSLQKIHWTAVADDKLQNSLWGSNTNAEDDIKDSEIAKLESLFSASPINKRHGLQQKKMAVAKKDTVKKTTRLIDPKRANNIAIALAQFRAFSNFDDLCQAVASLDGEHLDVEKLQNMQLIVPKSEEVKALQTLDGQDGLGRAELFFLSVMKVPRFPQKLAAFKYSLQFDEQAQSLISSLQLLARACAEVITSKKLAGILRRLLAIGNLMNESSGKPQAKGITLGSLIKTAKKKGSDGKTMVIDLLVSTAMSNKLDIVEFWSDMPTVRGALRLGLDDFRLMLREIETGAQSIERSIEAEKTEESQVISSEKSLAKLVPFLQRATGEIENIKNSFTHVEQKVQLMCSFFAEDIETCKASTIFGVLLDFSRIVDKSKEQHIRREKAMKRRQSMAKKGMVNATGDEIQTGAQPARSK